MYNALFRLTPDATSALRSRPSLSSSAGPSWTPYRCSESSISCELKFSLDSASGSLDKRSNRSCTARSMSPPDKYLTSSTCRPSISLRTRSISALFSRSKVFMTSLSDLVSRLSRRPSTTDARLFLPMVPSMSIACLRMASFRTSMVRFAAVAMPASVPEKSLMTSPRKSATDLDSALTRLFKMANRAAAA